MGVMAIPGNGTWGYYQGTYTIDTTATYSGPIYVGGAFTELEIKKEAKPNMRGLFEVIIVDPETDAIVAHGDYIAEDEAGAKMKAVLGSQKDGDLPKDLDDYDISARRLMDVRRKSKPQEVRIVKE